MGNSYVVEGAGLRCSCGSTETKLQIPFPRYSCVDGKKEATINDYLPNQNILPFGTCNQGKPKPCQPLLSNPWLQGKTQVVVEDIPCLLKSSTLQCQKGGVITVTDDGQA